MIKIIVNEFQVYLQLQSVFNLNAKLLLEIDRIIDNQSQNHYYCRRRRDYYYYLTFFLCFKRIIEIITELNSYYERKLLQPVDI